MSAVLITAEFNPLHLGHTYLLSQVRAHHTSSLIVCLMSGPFVQRGTPAIADRWTRAAMALKAGADVVLELPALYAVQGAAGFARGAVRIAQGLGVSVLAFGAEASALDSLEAAASLLRHETPGMSNAIREARRLGFNHGAARARALQQAAPELRDILRTPNNILAVEYLMALQELGTSITPFMVPRRAVHGREVTAHGIRAALRQHSDCSAVLRDAGVPLRFRPVFAEEELYRLALFRLRSACPDELTRIADISGPVASRLMQAASQPGYTQFIETASTRWLPQARVRRALLSIVLNFSSDMLDEVNAAGGTLHTRLLGVRTEALPRFGKLAGGSCIPIVSRCSQYPDTVLSAGDLRGADLYATIQSPPQDPRPDKAHRVVHLCNGELQNLPQPAPAPH